MLMFMVKLPSSFANRFCLTITADCSDYAERKSRPCGIGVRGDAMNRVSTICGSILSYYRRRLLPIIQFEGRGSVFPILGNVNNRDLSRETTKGDLQKDAFLWGFTGNLCVWAYCDEAVMEAYEKWNRPFLSPQQIEIQQTENRVKAWSLQRILV